MAKCKKCNRPDCECDSVKDQKAYDKSISSTLTKNQKIKQVLRHTNKYPISELCSMVDIEFEVVYDKVMDET